MEYYNEFKLTMETNAKAKEASAPVLNREKHKITV